MSRRTLCGWMLIGLGGVTWLLNLCFAQLKQLTDFERGSFYTVLWPYYLAWTELLIPAVLLLIGLTFVVAGAFKRKER